MDIVLFSDNQAVKKIFARLERSKEYDIRVLPLKTIKKETDGIRNHALFYVDLGSCPPKQGNNILKLLAGAKNISFGIIDPKEAIKDKAMLFFSGAGDYLGREQCKQGILPSRLQSVLAFKSTAAKNQDKPQVKESALAAYAKSVPARDWNMVEPGREYLFYMMFIELDGYQELHVRVGESAIGRLLSSFQKAVEKYLAGQKGKLWMWNDFGGIFLFPLAPKPDGIIASCMRLMLSRRLLSIEQCEQKVLLSYRIVLNLGSTVYRERGKTGQIISDSVNSLSHMGIRFAKAGNFYLTGELLANAKSDLPAFFNKAGTFNDVELFKMRLPANY